MPAAVLLLGLAAAGGACDEPVHNANIERRPLEIAPEGNWSGRGICYGPYRDGQHPDTGPEPTREQVREDLHILDGRFDLIRMYGAGDAAGRALDVIEADGLGLKVMLGAWIGTESGEAIDPGRDANEEQVAGVIALAKAHPGTVWAINVGNETQVYWSGHKIARERLIGYIRAVRDATDVPVTTCDDFNFWNKPESEAVAGEVDFMGLHVYAMWNGQRLADAMTWTRAQIDDVAGRHPGLPIVHAEGGWATTVHTEGQQAELIKGEPGETQQELYYRAYTSWAHEVERPYFYFSAFDENWKGGDHPDEVEKHWGLWNADRSPKLAVDASAPAAGD
ncbi:MAG: hypothetical protein DHS20C14_04760 [Phycisphaeraceae bacterium]|nr:MAG: hypothetical protein DHS20C14_04760 [Phycisphaeraceae bacterium]